MEVILPLRLSMGSLIVLARVSAQRGRREDDGRARSRFFRPFHLWTESKRKRGLRAKERPDLNFLRVNQFSQAPSACTHLKGCTSFAGCTGLDGSQCASCKLTDLQHPVLYVFFLGSVEVSKDG
jgi:hypothetical protein